MSESRLILPILHYAVVHLAFHLFSLFAIVIFGEIALDLDNRIDNSVTIYLVL